MGWLAPLQRSWQKARFGAQKLGRLPLAQRLLYAVTGTSVVVMAILAALSVRIAPELKTLESDLLALTSAYRQGGVSEFLRRKSELRRNVERTIRHSDSPRARVLAMSVATYLFPDVLPEGNFERDVGIEEWAPLAAAIEREPGTLRSRLTFERLRAMIWNYENPNRSAPALSSPAKEMISIYDSLSTSFDGEDGEKTGIGRQE